MATITKIIYICDCCHMRKKETKDKKNPLHSRGIAVDWTSDPAGGRGETEYIYVDLCASCYELLNGIKWKALSYADGIEFHKELQSGKFVKRGSIKRIGFWEQKTNKVNMVAA